MALTDPAPTWMQTLTELANSDLATGAVGGFFGVAAALIGAAMQRRYTKQDRTLEISREDKRSEEEAAAAAIESWRPERHAAFRDLALHLRQVRYNVKEANAALVAFTDPYDNDQTRKILSTRTAMLNSLEPAHEVLDIVMFSGAGVIHSTAQEVFYRLVEISDSLKYNDDMTDLISNPPGDYEMELDGAILDKMQAIDEACKVELGLKRPN